MAKALALTATFTATEYAAMVRPWLSPTPWGEYLPENVRGYKLFDLEMDWDLGTLVGSLQAPWGGDFINLTPVVVGFKTGQPTEVFSLTFAPINYWSDKGGKGVHHGRASFSKYMDYLAGRIASTGADSWSIWLISPSTATILTGAYEYTLTYTDPTDPV